MATNTKRRKRTVERISTKDALLDAAAELMAERASADFSLSEISERTGTNSALVSYYFGNKLGLMEALALRVLLPSIERLKDLVETDLPPEEKLVRHIRGMINVHYYSPFINRLLNYLGWTPDQEVSESINAQITRPMVELQGQIIDDGIRCGVFRKIDKTIVYFMIAGACESLFQNQSALRRAFNTPRISKTLKDDYVEEACAFILNGLAAGDTIQNSNMNTRHSK